jgi:hypothetical protein
MLHTRIRRSAALLMAGGALLVPAVASADDQSVYNTFHNSHPRFKKLKRDFDRGERHWENSGYSDPNDAYRACEKTSGLAKLVIKRIRAKHTSTTTGEKARNRAVKSIIYRKRWADAERSAIKSFMAFDGASYISRHRKAKDYRDKYQRYEELAFKLFKKAGVKSNP